MAPGAQHRVHVQKQEKTSPGPFFPFLWLHSPPPGAQPLSPTGSTLVCPCCFASLMQQWQSFELANVPVLQRLYVVPLSAGAMPAKGRRGMKEDGTGIPPVPEACYLCGEECGKEARPVAAKITNGNAKSTMHFPFLSLLPCPPGAKGLNKHWEVSSCRKCFGVLQDLWAMYRACHNEELISSVQSFLGRYHQVFSAGDLAGHPAVIKPGPTSVCYICGAELGAGREFQINVNPPGRFGEKEPFFPFLTVYPPAPRARPADSTGLVATCILCYHDLLGQWLQHEGRNSHHPSSAWSRQYKVETFVCFFCRQEKKRCLGLKAVQVARLPVFLYTLRVANSLLVDDGKQLTIGACAECGAVVLAGKSMTPPELLAVAPPSLLPKVRQLAWTPSLLSQHFPPLESRRSWSGDIDGCSSFRSGSWGRVLMDGVPLAMNFWSCQAAKEQIKTLPGGGKSQDLSRSRSVCVIGSFARGRWEPGQRKSQSRPACHQGCSEVPEGRERLPGLPSPGASLAS